MRFVVYDLVVLGLLLVVCFGIDAYCVDCCFAILFYFWFVGDVVWLLWFCSVLG